ncbi:hypothetical protein H257_06639 [Aphanomyces astaci]|uniref:LRRNT domain-containing protein n=1 Tax=Aphanomyces astaci TaxID=112090 RepID=W4GN42_APHAT|nr:hypothetical protein H257_06639 [Aphanomyces astaci]ETV80323.1 hypothetical protein H257_06639 [Aphanomyces astaci]|eukprot:XP_009830247.1 hypothetical protein H257_06639 [Aphanomyces astaci]
MLHAHAVWLLTTLAYVLQCSRYALACPSECFCFGSTRVTVHCEFRNLSSVPQYIPYRTTHLFLNGNNFQLVTADMFRGYTKNDRGEWNDGPVPLFQLREIKLDLNPMPVVSEFAFQNSPSLQLIYLPFYVQIQHQGLSEMRLDKASFDGFTRVPVHPLEDPTYVAFSRYPPQ